MSDARETPTSVEGFLTYRIVRVQARLNAQATRILSRVAGISLPQWRVLSLIGDVGETTSSAIVRRSAMDKGLVSRTLKSLHEEGLVASRTSRRDHRVQEHKLTARGQDLYDRTIPHMVERQAMIRSAFSPSELDAFETALQRLEHLAQIEAFDP